MREVCLPLWAPPPLGSLAGLLSNHFEQRESTGRGGIAAERGLRAPQIAIVLESRGYAHVCVCVGEDPSDLTHSVDA